MKVVHLIDSGGLYGAEQVLLSLCKEQQAQGITPIILSCGLPGEKDKPLELAAKQLDIDCIAWRMKAGINIKGMKLLLQHLKSERVELLHSHGYKFNILLGLFSKKALGLPSVSTVHGYVKAKFPNKMWIYEFLDRVFIRRMDRIILVSSSMLKIPAFSDVKKVQVINNGIPELIENESCETKNLSSPLKILAIGRLSKEKGFDYLINAVAELNKSGSSVHLTLFGEGREKSHLENLVSNLGQSNSISLKGFVSEPYKIFNEFDVLVMPSLTEGIPITLLEAMRGKINIIASSVGGIPEVLGEQYKFFVEPASVESLAGKIRLFQSLSDAERADHKILLNKIFIEKFSSRGMGDKYKQCYLAVTKLSA